MAHTEKKNPAQQKLRHLPENYNCYGELLFRYHDRHSVQNSIKKVVSPAALNLKS